MEAECVLEDDDAEQPSSTEAFLHLARSTVMSLAESHFFKDAFTECQQSGPTPKTGRGLVQSLQSDLERLRHENSEAVREMLKPVTPVPPPPPHRSNGASDPQQSRRSAPQPSVQESCSTTSSTSASHPAGSETQRRSTWSATSSTPQPPQAVHTTAPCRVTHMPDTAQTSVPAAQPSVQSWASATSVPIALQRAMRHAHLPRHLTR